MINPSQFAIQSLLFQMLERLLERLEPETGEAQSPTGQALATGVEGNSAFEPLIQQAAARYGVNPGLVRAVIRAESNFNPNAVSGAGAAGLMQLMPGTAAGLGVADSFDPAQNVDGGVRLLRQLLDRYDGNVTHALAAYNAGPGAVDRFGGVPPYTETQTYVKRVLANAGQAGSAPYSTWEA